MDFRLTQKAITAGMLWVIVFFQKLEENTADPVSRKEIGPSCLVSSESSGNGFTLLGETEPGHMENLSHRLRV